jgi:hypothetical protein
MGDAILSIPQPQQPPIGWNDASIIDTLARVLFSKGQVDKAIELQGKAVEKAKAPEMKQQLQKTLDEYKAKKNASK